jgi:N-acetyl-anhydromuramyl-L-alanine amidase AmpD
LQKHALFELIKQLRVDYPQARIVGHHDLPGVSKPCPCYNVISEYSQLR